LPSCQPSSDSGISAGQGPKGKHFYDWTRVALSRYGWPAGVGFWMLARHSIDDPEHLAGLGRCLAAMLTDREPAAGGAPMGRGPGAPELAVVVKRMTGDSESPYGSAPTSVTT